MSPIIVGDGKDREEKLNWDRGTSRKQGCSLLSMEKSRHHGVTKWVCRHRREKEILPFRVLFCARKWRQPPQSSPPRQ